MKKIPEKRILAVSKPLPKLLADLDLLEKNEKEQVCLVSTEQGILALSKSPKGNNLMQKEKKIRPVSSYLEEGELMIALTSVAGLLMLALSENRPDRIAEAHAITTGLIQRLLDAPRPVIIVWEGLIQNVIGLDKFHILDFDSLSDMTCPFCLERDLPFPHEELWLCPHCGTDLNGYQYDNAFQAHKQAAMIVNQIRSKWKRARLVHGAPGEEKTN